MPTTKPLDKLGELRIVAYDKGTKAGLFNPSSIAEQLGTSPENIRHIVRRKSFTSQYAASLDRIIAAAIPDYADRYEEYFDFDTPASPLDEAGKMVQSYARLIRDTAYNTDERIRLMTQLKDFLETTIPRLKTAYKKSGKK